jgi:hypothetical protein
MSVWTRREVLDFEAGLNVKESLDLCHIYRQTMAKGKWPVCLPPSTLNVCTSDQCFVRYTSHGNLAVGPKLAVCVGVFSVQGKCGVNIHCLKSNTFGETREPVPVQPQCVPLAISPIRPEGSAVGCQHQTASAKDGHKAFLLTRAPRVDIAALF